MNIKIFFSILLFAAFAVSCTKDEPHNHDNEDIEGQEYKFLRVLVSDELTNEISLVNPSSATVIPFNAKFEKSAVYTTESGRFAAIIHGSNNTIETFDSGFEFHGDHVDTKGTPKFGALIGESNKPTHFKSKKGELLTFNDGDGTLSVAKESDIHAVGAKFKTINAGLLAHHGAMATFANGTYAITEKDGSTAGALPEKVKVIDNAGKTLFDSKINVKRIHGNATDGTYAVFGSSEGILVVESNGNQKLIKNPADFGTAWFGTILETAMPGKFIAYTASKGAYLVDAASNDLKPIFESTNIMQCKVSYNETKLGLLLHSGEFKLYDLQSLKQEQSANIIAQTATDSKQKPQLQLSQRFAYITSPTTGELLQVDLTKLTVNKIKTSKTPYRITLFGFENSTSH